MCFIPISYHLPPLKVPTILIFIVIISTCFLIVYDTQMHIHRQFCPLKIFLDMSFKSLLLYSFTLPLFLFFMIYLLKNPSFLTCQVSHSLKFAVFILIMQCGMSLCPWYFLKTGTWILRLHWT